MNLNDKLQLGVTFSSAMEAQKHAFLWAKTLPEDILIGLSGDLGVGKTNWVKGMAQAWGIDNPVTSPSFGIYNIYQKERMLVHMDAYRLKNDKNFDNWNFEDFLNTPYVIAVEWPEYFDLEIFNNIPRYVLKFWIQNRKYYIKLLS